jgi:hypothetical protein
MTQFLELDRGYVPTWETHTKCRHGSTDCVRCGTSNRRDVIHSTVGGEGKVAKLRKREKR